MEVSRNHPVDAVRQRAIFFLNQDRPQSRVEAIGFLTQHGVRVLSSWGRSAIIGLATPAQIAAARAERRFVHVTGKAIRGGRSKEGSWSESQRELLAVWNQWFSKGYRHARKQPPSSWARKDRLTPGGLSVYDPKEIEKVVLAYAGKAREHPRDESALSSEEFIRLERRLAEQTGDATRAYHLARALYKLDRSTIEILFDNPSIFHHLPPPPPESCGELEGTVAVGVVFVESGEGGPNFSSSERNALRAGIADGLTWLASQAPVGAHLNFAIDWQFTTIGTGNQPSPSPGKPDPSYDRFWTAPGMQHVNFQGSTYGTDPDPYRSDLRAAFRADHSYLIFVMPFDVSWYAYQSGGSVLLSSTGDYGGWGCDTVDRITAHETLHVFGTADEYSGAGTPCSSCDGAFGCDQIPNGNCAACSHPHQGCIMDRDERRLCAYTQAQVGWADLLVELTTADVDSAGTDDEVWLDIGDRSFYLDTPDIDDRERNDIQAYSLRDTGLTRGDIKRIMIRKSPDSDSGGWMLKRVRVWFLANPAMESELLCDDDNIFRWLEDESGLTWVCQDFVAPDELVSSLTVFVSTGDVEWAGTDDDVTFEMGGRSWNLDNPGRDDFERAHTDDFPLDPSPGLYRSMLHGLRIHKSPDGHAGGWFLHGLRIEVNGATLFDHQSIDKWLEDDDRDWFGTL
jgi:hypothetical protein